MMLKSKEILCLIAIILVELMLEILSFVVVPVALLFCKKDDEHLPKIFRWFEDANDYYDGKCAAINGDSGWREKHYPEPTNRTYKARLLWLLRNKIGRFSSEINGVKVDDVNPYSIETLGDPYITSNGGKKSGFCNLKRVFFADQTVVFAGQKGSFCRPKSVVRSYELRIFYGF